MRTKRTILVLCGTLLATAAACSSSSDTTGTGPAPLVEKSYAISTGDAVCQALVSDIGTLVSQFKASHPNPSANDAQDFLVNTVMIRVDHGVGDMHRIGQPTKDRADFDTAVKALDDDLAALKRTVGDDPVKVLNSGVKLFDKSTKPFADYGFKQCGKNP